MDKDEKIVESRKLDSLLQKRLRQDYCSASLRPQLREGDYQLTEMPLWEKTPMRPIMHDKLCRNVEYVCSGATRVSKTALVMSARPWGETAEENVRATFLGAAENVYV